MRTILAAGLSAALILGATFLAMGTEHADAQAETAAPPGIREGVYLECLKLNWDYASPVNDDLPPVKVEEIRGGWMKVRFHPDADPSEGWFLWMNMDRIEHYRVREKTE